MAKKNKECYCGFDFDDILTVPATYKTIKWGEKGQEKTFKIKVAPEKKYVRMVALKDFIVQGKLVTKGEKGGYFQLKGGMCVTSIGEKSWVEGSFTGTELHPTVVGWGCSIGNNTLIGKNCTIGRLTEIRGNCKIGECCKIEKNCVIEDNVVLVDTVVGENTIISKNTTIGVKELNGKFALGVSPSLIGVSPNYYNYYWWNLGLDSQTFQREKPSLRTFLEKYVKEKYYKFIPTYIGPNVQMSCGTQVFAGGIVRQNAKLGHCSKVCAKGYVGEERVVDDKEQVTDHDCFSL